MKSQSFRDYVAAFSTCLLESGNHMPDYLLIFRTAWNVCIMAVPSVPILPYWTSMQAAVYLMKTLSMEGPVSFVNHHFDVFILD